MYDAANLMKLHLAAETDRYEIARLQEALLYHDSEALVMRPVRLDSIEGLKEVSQHLKLPSPPDVCIRLCNIHHALQQFNAFSEDIRERFGTAWHDL